MINERLRSAILIVVTSVWALNFTAGLIPQLDYNPSESINGIFMAVVGGVLGLTARNGIRKQLRKNDEEESP